MLRLNLDKDQIDLLEDLERDIFSMKKIIENPILRTKDQDNMMSKKIKIFFDTAKSLIGEERLNQFLETRNMSNKKYDKDLYPTAVNLYYFIKNNKNGDIFIKKNGDIDGSSTTKNFVDNNCIKEIQNTLKNKPTATFELISKKLGLEYTINDNNFENVFKYIDKIKKNDIHFIYNNLSYINNNFAVNDNVKEKIEDLLEYIQERINKIKEDELKDKIEDKTEVEKRRIERQEEERLKKEKIKNVLDTQLSIFEDIVFQTNTEIQNMNGEKKDDILDIKNKMLDSINLIIKNITKSFNGDPNYSLIIKEIYKLKEIYNNMDLKRFKVSMEKGYLLGDIYESLINMQNKYQIELSIDNYKNLNIGIKKYKLNQL